MSSESIKSKSEKPAKAIKNVGYQTYFPTRTSLIEENVIFCNSNICTLPFEFCLLSFFLLFKTQFRFTFKSTLLLLRSGEKLGLKNAKLLTEDGDETGDEALDEVNS